MDLKQPFAFIVALTLVATHGSFEAYAQETEQTPLETSETNTVLDRHPVGTARSASMSESLGSVADDLDAFIFNPSGIGGQHHKKSTPLIRKLYFPHVSLFANKDSLEIGQEFRGKSDGALIKALVDAHAGKRQYGRISSVVGLVFGRVIVVPFNDIQVAAVSQGNGSDLIDMRYRSQSGVGYGF